MTFKHNKTPRANPGTSQAGNSPQQGCLPFALPPGFPCLRGSWAKQECRAFAFSVDLSCSAFLKDFSSLTDIPVLQDNIQFPATLTDLLFFSPCLVGICLVLTVPDPSLIIPPFSRHFLPAPIPNLPTYFF